MIDEVQEAKDMLRAIAPSLPWRFDEVPQPEKWQNTDVRFGAVRTKTGQNVVQPFEGSSSIMMGIPVMVEMVIKAPAIINGLLQRIDELTEQLEETQKAPVPVKTTRKLAKTA